MTIVTLRMIQKETEVAGKPAYRGEICRIKVIYWTFVLTYAIWFLYDLVFAFYPNLMSNMSRFVVELNNMIIATILDYVPILIVLYAHFKSYSSVSRLLKIVMTQK